MAAKNSINFGISKEPTSFTFATIPDFYHLSSKVSASDVIDQINAKLSQLEAQLAMTTGEAGESFRRLNDDLQGNFMWGCQHLAIECRQLLSILSTSERTDTANTQP